MYYIYQQYNDLCELYRRFSLSVLAIEVKQKRPKWVNHERASCLRDADDVGWIQKLIIDKTKMFYNEVDRSIREVKWHIDRVNKLKEFFLKTNKVTQSHAMKKIHDYEYFALPKLKKELMQREAARQWYIGEYMMDKDNPFYAMDF